MDNFFAIRLIVAMTALIAQSVTGQETGSSEATLVHDIAVLADGMDVPGAAWAVVVDGRVKFLGAHGIADKANGILVDPTDSVFRIASVSKVFTASAVARLVSGKQLDLDTDLQETWPWLTTRLGDDGPISLRQLLTHTSGLGDRFLGMFCSEVGDVQPLDKYLRAHLPRRTTPAGHWTRYSNHGFALAGLALEESTGLRYAEAVRTLIFEPVGMNSSTFAQPLPDGLRARLARAYPSHDAEPLPLDWRNTSPAGAMVTSAHDMSLFLQTLVNNDSPLESSTIDLLTRQHFTANPQIPGLALALYEQILVGRRALVHAGSSSGYRSLFVVIPDARAGLFLVATGGDGDFGAQVLARFCQEIGKPTGPDDTVVSIVPSSDDKNEEYAGSYLMSRAPQATAECFPALFLFGDALTLDQAGYLVRREGGNFVRYGLVARDVFQALDGPGRLAFERDASGNISALHASDVFFGARFPATYERLPWWSEPGLMNEVLSWTLGLPLLACLGWLIQRVAVRIYHRFRKSGADGGGTRRFRSWVAFVICATVAVLMVAFGFGFMARLNGLARSAPEQLAYGLPFELALLLWIPYALAVLTVAVCATSVRTWWRRGPIADRMLLTITSIAALVFLVLLIHFRMLPPAI